MKCLRLKIFLPRPSIFHVRATKVLIRGREEESVAGGEEASTTGAELSDPMSLTASRVFGLLGDRE